MQFGKTGVIAKGFTRCPTSYILLLLTGCTTLWGQSFTGSWASLAGCHHWKAWSYSHCSAPSLLGWGHLTPLWGAQRAVFAAGFVCSQFSHWAMPQGSDTRQKEGMWSQGRKVSVQPDWEVQPSMLQVCVGRQGLLSLRQLVPLVINTGLFSFFMQHFCLVKTV